MTKHRDETASAAGTPNKAVSEAVVGPGSARRQTHK